MITGYEITPDVLMPGDIGSVTVTVTNTAQQATMTRSASSGDEPGGETRSLTVPVNAFIESVSMKTKDFEVLSGWYEDVGDIGPGQSIPLTFLIRAPPAEGIYFPEIWIRIRDSGSVKYPLPVNVNTAYKLAKSPSLTVTRDIPVHIAPGESFNISLNLKNEGRTRAHEVTIQVETPNRSFSSLTPERIFLGDISMDDHKQVTLSFMTDRDIPIGIRQIPVRIRYLSADGSPVNDVAHIGVLVRGKGEVGIAKFQTEPVLIPAGDQVTFLFRVENTGTDDAKSVRVTLDIPFEGMKDAFIGTIEPHTDAPAVFSLKAAGEGDIPFETVITYQDEYGTHSVTVPLMVTVGDGNGSWIMVLMILIIAAGLGVYLVKRRHSS